MGDAAERQNWVHRMPRGDEFVVGVWRDGKQKQPHVAFVDGHADPILQEWIGHARAICGGQEITESWYPDLWGAKAVMTLYLAQLALLPAVEYQPPPPPAGAPPWKAAAAASSAPAQTPPGGGAKTIPPPPKGAPPKWMVEPTEEHFPQLGMAAPPKKAQRLGMRAGIQRGA